MNLEDDLIYKFFNACWRVGLKDPVAFLISRRHQIFDWAIGIFPRGCLPTDVDGELEINDHILRFEYKAERRLRNGCITVGQFRLFKSLIKTGRFTIFIIGHNLQNQPTCMIIMYPNGHTTKLIEVTLADVQKRCTDWAAWAETH